MNRSGPTTVIVTVSVLCGLFGLKSCTEGSDDPNVLARLSALEALVAAKEESHEASEQPVEAAELPIEPVVAHHDLVAEKPALEQSPDPIAEFLATIESPAVLYVFMDEKVCPPCRIAGNVLDAFEKHYSVIRVHLQDPSYTELFTELGVDLHGSPAVLAIHGDDFVRDSDGNPEIANPVDSWVDESGNVLRYEGNVDRVYELFLRPRRIEESDLPPEAQPTPESKVQRAVSLLMSPSFWGSQLDWSDCKVVDYGCGFDARVCITAVESGCHSAVGVEIDPDRADSARWHVAQAGLSDRIQIITGDAAATNVQADAAFVYLWPDSLERLRDRLVEHGRVVSYIHQVPGLSMRFTEDLWWWHGLSQPAQRAYWNGVAYSGPLCDSPNCRMCQSIRAQLAL